MQRKCGFANAKIEGRRAAFSLTQWISVKSGKPSWIDTSRHFGYGTLLKVRYLPEIRLKKTMNIFLCPGDRQGLPVQHSLSLAWKKQPDIWL
jgi:hypothetical protein